MRIAFVMVAAGLAGPVFGQCAPTATQFCVTEDGVYSINGVPQAAITLVRGTTYTFKMVGVASSHPFYITTSPSGGGSGMYSNGVSPTQVSGNATMTFAVPASAPNQLYYGCTNHSGMGGPISIVNPPSCYANCDGSTTAPVLNVADFSCFLSKFAAGNAYANCDGSTTTPVLNVADFSCFLSKFAAGCP